MIRKLRHLGGTACRGERLGVPVPPIPDPATGPLAGVSSRIGHLGTAPITSATATTNTAADDLVTSAPPERKIAP